MKYFALIILVSMISTVFGIKNSKCTNEECSDLLEFCKTKGHDHEVELLCKLNFQDDTTNDIVNNNITSNSTKQKPSQSSVWGYGILCVTIISLMSVMGVSFMPLMSKPFYDKLLTTLIGLAIGSLSGSALFHLIPSAFSLADHYPHHDYLTISLVIWSGVYLFFIIERFLKIFMELKNRKNGSEHKLPESENNDKNENGGCAGELIPKVAVYENRYRILF